jgi:hypothetical protein
VPSKRESNYLMLKWILLACTVTLPITACSRPMHDRTLAEYRENADPRRAYRVTMTIRDAPGPLKIMVSAAQYDVVNRECLPPPKENPGGRSSPVPTRDIPFELTEVSEGVYQGTVYADAMLDEDYHGRGVCRWELIQAQVQLTATGASGETKFIASVSSREGDFRPGNVKTLYYWKGQYPHAGVENYPDFGREDVGRYRPELRGELFAIILETVGGGA